MARTIAMLVLARNVVISVLLAALLGGQVLAGQGLVYRLVREGGAPSYLIGTMHSEDPRVTGLLSEVAPLIEQSRIVALEMLPDAVTMLAVGAATLLPLDQSLRDQIGSARFEALAAAAASRGLAPGLLNRLKPWAAAVTLGMPAADTGRFLDVEIYLYALDHRRRAVGLETAAEQLAVFDEMPFEVQLALLDEMIKNAPLLPTQLETLTAAYLSGDLDRLQGVALEQYRDLPPAARSWFDERLIAQRNRRMLSRIMGLLGDGPVFVAVGAMHLGGEDGILAGLRRHGLRVEHCCD